MKGTAGGSPRGPYAAPARGGAHKQATASTDLAAHISKPLGERPHREVEADTLNKPALSVCEKRVQLKNSC